MKNKKTLFASIGFGATLIIITIIGSLFCNWAIYLLPISLLPTAIWLIKNRKNLSINIKKNVIRK